MLYPPFGFGWTLWDQSWEVFSNHRFWNYGIEKWTDQYGSSRDYLPHNTVRSAQVIGVAICRKTNDWIKLQSSTVTSDNSYDGIYCCFFLLKAKIHLMCIRCLLGPIIWAQTYFACHDTNDSYYQLHSGLLLSPASRHRLASKALSYFCQCLGKRDFLGHPSKRNNAVLYAADSTILNRKSMFSCRGETRNKFPCSPLSLNHAEFLKLSFPHLFICLVDI